MPPPIPRCSNWTYSSLNSPSCFSLPRYGSRIGLHIFLFEACSTFTRVAASLDRAARDLGIEIVLFMARSKEEIIDAIDGMKAKSIDAVNVLASARLSSFQSLILDRLTSQRLPSIYQWPHGAEDGWLIAYGPRLDGINRQCGRQVTKLLRGAKVADVPVEQPTELVLTINLKTAKALGVIIPPTLLSRADRVID
jgi:putative ABC transport system substrate-binding protein